LKLDNWKHTQPLDYEQLPFKCKGCHEYGHFAKGCKKNKQEEEQSNKEEKWQATKKSSRRNKFVPNKKSTKPRQETREGNGEKNKETKNRFTPLEEGNEQEDETQINSTEEKREESHPSTDHQTPQGRNKSPIIKTSIKSTEDREISRANSPDPKPSIKKKENPSWRSNNKEKGTNDRRRRMIIGRHSK